MCLVKLTHTMQAYSPNSGLILGQRRSPLLVQCQPIVYDTGPTLQYSNIGSAVYLAAAPHQKRAIHPILLVQRIPRWPAIETALGDCPVFGGLRITMRVTLCPSPRRQKSNYPDNSIY